MTHVNPGFASRELLVNRPLLMTPRRAMDLLSGFAARGEVERGFASARVVRAYAGDGDDADRPVLLKDMAAASASLMGPRDDTKPYRVVDGVAIIQIRGDLIHKLGTLDPWWWCTGYDGIAFKVGWALADPDVKGILLDIDSPGGMVDGCAACGDVIARAAKVKPVWAALSDTAYSAAFWLGSHATRILVPRTGGIGSVGVVTMHVDCSRALDEWGYTITVIHAGAHKADGHPYAPLPDPVLADITADLEMLRGQFAGAVAAGRGMDLGAVLATEARCLLAEEGVSVGFADEILNPDDALSAFIEHLAGDGRIISTPAASAAKPEGVPMATKPKTGARGGLSAARAHLTAKPKASEGQDEDKEADKAKAAEEGDEETEDENATAAQPDEGDGEDDPDDEETDEEGAKAKGDGDGDGGDDPDDEEEEASAKSAAVVKARIKAILSAPEAKACPGLAQRLAFDSDMSVKNAIAAMAAAAADGAGAKGRGFAEAMESFRGPALGGDPGKDKARTAGLSAAREHVTRK